MDARRQRLTLVGCILGSTVVFVDGTVVNVALPAIRADLGVGLSDQQWIVDAYLLTLGSLLLVGGSLGDLYGRRRVFALGVVGFGVTSVLCALAPGASTLIVARGLQGMAGALLVPSTLGIITAEFDDDQRGRAIGTWTAWSGIATVIGPLGGGLVLEVVSWRFIFAINILPILATLLLIRSMSAAHDHPRGGRPDLVGGALCAIGLGGPVFALIEQPRYGWTDPLIWVSLVGGALVFAAFLAYEARARDPMLPLGLFRGRNFSVGNASTLFVYGGLGAAMFLVPVFLQEAAGYSPLQAGTALLPMSVLLFLLASRMGALADRHGPRWFMGFGPLVAAAGIALLALMDSEVSYVVDVLPGAAVFGLGLAMTVAPLTATVLGGVEEEHAGLASGVNNAIARVAGLVAIASIGAIVASAFTATVQDRLGDRPLGVPAERAVRVAEQRSLSSQVPPGLGVDRAAVGAAIRAGSEQGYAVGMLVAALSVLVGGVLSLVGIANPVREVPCAECAGGALAGAPRDAAQPEPELPRVRVPAPEGA